MNRLQSIEIEAGPLGSYFLVTFYREYDSRDYCVGAREIHRLSRVLNAYQTEFKYKRLSTSVTFHPEGRVTVEICKKDEALCQTIERTAK